MRKILCWLTLAALLLSLPACGTQTPATRETQPSPEETLLEERILEETAHWLMEAVPQPGYGALGGEWLILGLARSGLEIPRDYFTDYGERVSALTAQQGGILHQRKYTEYSRVILAWTALGRNPADVGGFNLLIPLADYDQTVFQGVNGAVFALLALDCGAYSLPENPGSGRQATRELYVDYLLSAQTADGGWTLAGDTGDVDLTAMALQALAGYQDRPDVAKAVEKGLTLLSELQNDQGGFSAGGDECSESIAQVLVALTELGLSPADGRFVKNGNTLQSRLLDFRREDGGFSHTLEAEADLMATEQCFYALVSVARHQQGKSSLYTMTEP